MNKFLGLFSTEDRGNQWREVVGFFKFCFGAKKKKLNHTQRGFQEGWRIGKAFISGFSSGVQVASMFQLKGLGKGWFKVYCLSS